MKKQNVDWYILLPVIGLMLFSLTFVYSASFYFSISKHSSDSALLLKHFYKVVLGILIIIIFSKIDYHFYRKISKPLLFISIIMLIVVLFVGAAAKGATRWLDLKFISIQPSELAKFAMVIHFASMLSSKQEYIKDFYKGFLPFLIWTGLVGVLIALQPNFSTMAVVLMISFSLMFIGNVNLLYLLAGGAIGGTVAGLYLVSAPYRMKRLLSYFSGDGSNIEGGYQLKQALIAIGNGGFSGVGPGQSRQSMLFLPESYGDFIFSIIGEEWGFIGLFLILLCFGLIFWRGMLIAKNAPDNFGYFLSVGIIITFAFYVFVNAGVNTGLLPTTGVPFPFLSYGGTAILIYSAAIGILLNVSAHAGIYKIKENQSIIE